MPLAKEPLTLPSGRRIFGIGRGTDVLTIGAEARHTSTADECVQWTSHADWDFGARNILARDFGRAFSLAFGLGSFGNVAVHDGGIELKSKQ